MATKEEAKKKFVDSVTSDLAPRKMATKLSTYLGITVSESAGPIKNWKDVVAKNAEELFDKMYDHMKLAYK
jgi:accessory colonization factor AcfC